MAGTTDLQLPFPKSWWIDPGRIIGGCFPGTPEPEAMQAMLSRLLDVGVRTVINLQVPGERGNNGRPFPDYAPVLKQLAQQRGIEARAHRHPITDMGIPSVEEMKGILAAIDAALAEDHRVYVHCWGGHGRTGTVAGCWHARCGMDFDRALAAIAAARRHDDYLRGEESPQTREQRRFVREWIAL
jgi:hypothetical protein